MSKIFKLSFPASIYSKINKTIKFKSNNKKEFFKLLKYLFVLCMNKIKISSLKLIGVVVNLIAVYFVKVVQRTFIISVNLFKSFLFLPIHCYGRIQIVKRNPYSKLLIFCWTGITSTKIKIN